MDPNWPQIAEQFETAQVPAPLMDRLWAAGWRHFGRRFFRMSFDLQDGRPARILPLRVNVGAFEPSKSQRRVLRANADLECRVEPAVVGAEQRLLFEAHKVRFKSNVPERLEDFLGENPASGPCATVQVGLWLKDRLVAAAFLDLGVAGVSSVYATFDPGESRRSLGVCTVLKEIELARIMGARHYYIGYAHDVPSPYDYKKRFGAAEVYDWRFWRPWQGGGEKP
jgi:leucyl-tRNA---protein transferase